ncbi:hypothetical protein T265_05712 [Opisthorchis viverrini]|uniref:FAD dependent oxidoreductase domain-containing protein n=1 Tax=Opisthorchis viverrini TaxID=6198 RepID=A0A074ZN77_OPIVI|nr:hypothetical protein T265_05712 [Opisthorchis viverrini]KER27177.1 hypothetical protein T265_05712 [Opisthorchis viverrini]
MLHRDSTNSVIDLIFQETRSGFTKKHTTRMPPSERDPCGARRPKWLEREFTDRKVRGSNPTSASQLPLSRLRQPGSIPVLVFPSGSMAVRHRKGVTAERWEMRRQLVTVYVVRPGRHSPPRQSPDPNSELDPQNLQPGLDAPFLIDPKRLFLERRGLSGEFIVYSDNPQWDSVQQSSTSETAEKLDVDYTFFKRELSKQLGHRIPSLASAEVTSAWTAICDYNTVDQNLIIGHHPFYVNMFFCNGSSGHGAQHAIAIGRAVSELIIYGHYKSIDLTRFCFERLCLNEPVEETNAF